MQMPRKGEEMLGISGVFFSVMSVAGEGGGYITGGRVVISKSILWQSSFIIFFPGKWST